MGFTSILDGLNEPDRLWLSCQSVVTLLSHTDIGRMTLAPGLGNYTALGLELIISDVSDL